MRTVFADTGYWIALIFSNDQLHHRANAIADGLEDTRLLTTQMVLVEVLNHASRMRTADRQLANDFVARLEADERVQIIPQTETQFADALERYAARPDQSWRPTAPAFGRWKTSASARRWPMTATSSRPASPPCCADSPTDCRIGVMPIANDMGDVERRFKAFFEADAGGRPLILRRLLLEVLDFERDDGAVSLAQARRRPGVALPPEARRLGELKGVRALFIDLSDPAVNPDDRANRTDRVRQGDMRAAVDDIERQLGRDMLLLVADRSGEQLHWIYPDIPDAGRPTLRRIVVERGVKQRTATQQVAKIWQRYEDSGDIHAALEHAFDVEPVTTEFFKQYQRLFERARELVSGFDDPEDCKSFVQTLFNRLMFVYFLSRKGWLRYPNGDGRGNTDYLNALWDAYAQHPQHANFYDDRLWHVFFSGLNNPDSRDLRGGVDFVIGEVPFLNGGLFEETELDRRDGVIVPDDAIRPLLTDLFDRFNFTVMESTPFDIEVAVDPEMLGKVFEELVTGRHASGAYYTPRPVVAFMCREALKGYLETRATDLSAEAIAAFVERRETERIDPVAAPVLAAALENVTVVDPACGSGAYLVGMMQELVELRQALFNVGAGAQPLHRLKLHIIERNLYGADIDQFAVNTAMLRLWLSLAIEYEGDDPQPLPNLDFKIVLGDSLLGPDPSQISLDSHAIRESGLASLKAAYLRARASEEKRLLRERIDAANNNIRAIVGDANIPAGAIDWRVDFAEVIGEGGFDIAIANPPYVRQEKIGPTKPQLVKQYKHAVTGKSDYYTYFYVRGCQLLCEGGLLVYITSNSWLRAQYGKKLRAMFAEHHKPLRWLDLGKDVFDAVVDSGVLLLRTGGEAKPFPAIDLDDLPEPKFPPPDDSWREARPSGDEPWSLLSPLEWSVIDKMQTLGTPLSDWDIMINAGIKTSRNEAFVIDTAARNALIAEDPKSAEIIKPILRGEDIDRWRAKWAGLWLIDTHNGYDDVAAIDIDEYPAVKRHLDTFLPKLKARRGQGRTPYNLSSCAHRGEFTKEKLFCIDLTNRGRFCFDDGTMLALNSTYMITGVSIKYLCALLNATLTSWYVQSVGMTSGTGTSRWITATISTVPVLQIASADQASFVALTDEIVSRTSVDNVLYTPADSRQQTADSRQQTADSRQQTADSRQQTADSRQQTADSRQQTADSRQQTADSRQLLLRWSARSTVWSTTSMASPTTRLPPSRRA